VKGGGRGKRGDTSANMVSMGKLLPKKGGEVTKKGTGGRRRSKKKKKKKAVIGPGGYGDAKVKSKKKSLNCGGKFGKEEKWLWGGKYSSQSPNKERGRERVLKRT